MKRFTRFFSALLICTCLVLPTLCAAEISVVASCEQQGHPMAITHVAWHKETPVDAQLHQVERAITGTCACGKVEYKEEKIQIFNEVHTLINGVCRLCGYGVPVGATKAPAAATKAPASETTASAAATTASAATPAPTATPAPAQVTPSATVCVKPIKNANDANEVGTANIGHYAVINSSCNIRKDASAASERIGGADAGDRFVITGYKINGTANLWYEIMFGERKGYVSSGLVTVEAAESAPAQEAPAQEAEATEAPGANAAVELSSGTLVGRYVTFGHYEQDGNAANGVEPILWQVLDVNAARGQLLLCAVDALEVLPFDEYGSAVWAGSTLRRYLNQDFCAAAFTAEEQAQLVLAYVDAPFYSNRYADSERDLVFVPSQADLALMKAITVSAYDTEGVYAAFASCVPSHAAALRLGDSDVCAWWLRDATDSGRVSLMSEDGEVTAGRASALLAVRPAVWVNAYAQELAFVNAPAQTSDLSSEYTMGAKLLFGHDGDGNALAWTIMSVDNESGSMLVMADYTVAEMPLNATPADWNDTELRAWLNGEFMAGAFTDGELRVLMPMDVSGLNDYVTCPSLSELDRYAGAWFVQGAADWKTRAAQLRDPMHESYWLRDVTQSGAALYDGWEMTVTQDAARSAGVRPVVCLDVAELMQLN